MTTAAWGGGAESGAPHPPDAVAVSANLRQPRIAAEWNGTHDRHGLEYVPGDAASIMGFEPDDLRAPATIVGLHVTQPYDYRYFNIGGGTLKIRMASGLRFEYRPNDAATALSVTASTRRIRFNISVRW